MKTSSIFFLLGVLAFIALLVRYPVLRGMVPWQKFAMAGIRALA